MPDILDGCRVCPPAAGGQILFLAEVCVGVGVLQVGSSCCVVPLTHFFVSGTVLAFLSQ